MTDLQELGLSAYEEGAYRALCSTGAATARTVADRSDVPAGRIYDVLNGLESRGLVRTHDGDPRRYAPVDPDAAIDRLLTERLDDLDARAERYRDLAADVRSTLAPTPPMDGNVWLADFGDEDSTTLVAEQLSTVTDRFAMAVGPPYVAASLADYEAEIAAFVEHLPGGVSVDFLLDRSLVETLSNVMDSLEGTDVDLSVRAIQGVDVTFDVVDGTEAYVELVHPFAAGHRFGFVEVREPAVADELESLFDAAWERAEPVN